MAEIVENSRYEQKTITTQCTITFDCGCTKNVDIAHFCPKDEDEITLGKNNRVISEERQHVCEPKTE